MPLASERTGRELLEMALTAAKRIATHEQRGLVVIQQQRQVAYLLLGSRATIMHRLFGSPSRAFFRLAVPMELPPIPWPEWARRPLGGGGLSD